VKKIITVLSLMVFLCGLCAANSFAESQPPAKEPNQPAYLKLISPDKLKEDLDFLFKTIEEVHPNMYAYTNKEEFSPLREELYSQITQPMTRLEFYKITCPLVVSLKNGHMNLNYHNDDLLEFSNNGGKFFPLFLNWDRQSATIIKNYSEQNIPMDVEIVSIDDENIKELITKSAKYHSEEQKEGSMARGALKLGRYYWLENREIKPWEIIVKKSNGSIRNITIEPVSMEKVKEKAKKDLPEVPYEFKSLNNNTGLLEFNSHSGSFENFEKFLKDTFTQIKGKKLKYLIIDVRKNGGGNSNLGDMLLKYLTDEPFRQFEKVEGKVSKQVLQQQGIDLEKAREMLGAPNIEIGSVRSYESPMKIPGENPLRFNGKIYVLMGQRTFSSAQSFVAAIKCFNIAALIGEETRSTTTEFGDILSFNMPNTGLPFTVPYKHFVEACGTLDGRGVIPDYEVKQKLEDTAKGADTVLQFTLNLIKKGDLKKPLLVF